MNTQELVQQFEAGNLAKTLKSMKFVDLFNITKQVIYEEYMKKFLLEKLETDTSRPFKIGNFELDDEQIEDLKKSTQQSLLCFNQVKSIFYARVANKGEVASVFNQLYAEAVLCQGQKGPTITYMNIPISEREIILMSDQKFDANLNKVNIPVDANVSLLSSKHNACPCIVGINEDRQIAVLWHISYGEFEMSSNKINIPKNLQQRLEDANITFVGLNLPRNYSIQLADIQVKQNYALPSDLHIETFVVSGEPISYDISYYPNSDTVILWGTDTQGLPCAWYKSDVVNPNVDKNVSVNWNKAVLGTKEHPTLNWETFLLEYYKTHKPPPLSEDSLIKEFYIKFKEQEKHSLMDSKKSFAEKLKDTSSRLTNMEDKKERPSHVDPASSEQVLKYIDPNRLPRNTSRHKKILK